MSAQQISQRDLRQRSREIMDAVEGGTSFTVTRDGREIAQLTPRPQRKTFLSRDELAALFSSLPPINPEKLRYDIDAEVDPYLHDPFAR